MANLKKWLAALAVCGLALGSDSSSSAADHSTKPGINEAAFKHSARYTRLLGTASGKVPVRFADHQASSPTPVRTVGWGGYYGYGPRFYGGYGPGYYGGYYGAGYGPGYYGGYYGAGYGAGYYGGYYGAGYRSPYYGAAPYGGFYGYGYRPYGWYGYRPYSYAYQPWVGVWGGYSSYGALPYATPIYTTGYAGYVRPGLGYYGGCCYW